MAIKFYKVLIVFLILNISKAYSSFNSERSDTLDYKKISWGISLSPRFSNVIFRDFYSSGLKREYISGYIFMNYNVNAYYNFKNKKFSIDLGFSLLQYGVKQNHVAAFASNSHGVSYYDSISIKEALQFLALQIGVKKKIAKHFLIYECEIGVVNNYFHSATSKAFEAKYQGYYEGYGVLFTNKYFPSLYLKLGLMNKTGKYRFFLNPIINYTPFNLFPYNEPGFVKLYQIGIDFGVRLN